MDLNVADNLTYTTIEEACSSLFNYQPPKHGFLTSAYIKWENGNPWAVDHDLWFPQESPDKNTPNHNGWNNTISANDTLIEERKFTDGQLDKSATPPIPLNKRITFLKELNSGTYRFVGIFAFDPATSSNGVNVYRRTATSTPIPAP